MTEFLKAQGVQLDERLIAIPDAIRTVQRYHAALRLAYGRIPPDSEIQVSDYEYLHHIVFAIKRTVGPERFHLALIMFRAGARPEKIDTGKNSQNELFLLTRR